MLPNFFNKVANAAGIREETPPASQSEFNRSAPLRRPPPPAAPISTGYHQSSNMAFQPRIFKASKTPSDDLALSNKIFFNPGEINPQSTPYVKIANRSRTGAFLFTVGVSPNVEPGYVSFAAHQRRWATISLEEDVQVFGCNDPNNNLITGMTVWIDHHGKQKSPTIEPLNTDTMATEFLMNFANNVFTVGQEVLFRYKHNDKVLTLSTVVKEIDAMNPATQTTKKEVFGRLIPNGVVIFDKKPEAQLSLTGKNKGKSAQRSLINPEWDFQKIGIGGLDKEFSDIFRRAFASRVFPAEYSEQLGMKHVRGILLYGPPGTGKTLIARQIGKMLNAREPKIVNGPEILNKYVGESEANMRKLFADAEEEWRRCGSNSGLHMIIFDEIDAICKQRGSQAGSTGVSDTMVNQLLTKLDGVEQLNNILVIGMTNRRDMIDEALLRPGRMEVQLEISLPDEHGRVQILKIHTARMREYKKLGDDVNIDDIAKRTKNFSGAEIEGLVRAAQSSAMNRLIKVGSKVEIDEEAVEKLKVTMEDFDYALENDIKPAFGTADDVLASFLRGGLVNWGPDVGDILKIGQSLAMETSDPQSRGFVKALFTGARNTGKTFLAAKIAKDTEFPFVKVCTPENMVGFSETAKCQVLNKMFNDAYKSPLSVLIIDNLERLLDYTPIGPRFSNLVLQALDVLLNKKPPPGHRLLVLATSSVQDFLQEVDLTSCFSKVVRVRQLHNVDEIMSVAEQSEIFDEQAMTYIRHNLNKFDKIPTIGIKSLLEMLDFVRVSDQPPQTLVQELEALVLGF
uniref:Vesicle-fusing ATPase n=1 Tax=Panagrellus redivivus TaxID=6233 RepID=A0A7E4V7Z1_PANRE